MVKRSDPVPADDVYDHRGDLESRLAAVLEAARASGADSTEAVVSLRSGLDVSVRLGEVETLEHQRDRVLALTVYFGQRKGTARTSDLGDQAIRETVAAACEIARHTEGDPCNGLADAALMPTELPELDLYHPWAMTPTAAMDMARSCEQAALALDPRIDNSDGASVATSRALRIYANSHGFTGTHAGTRHTISCAVIAREQDAMQRDGWYTVATRHAALESPELVGRQAGQRALARLGARRLDTCRAPVLFTPETARGLVSHLVAAASGGALYRRASFLCDRLGEQVTSPLVSLRELPHLPQAMGSAAFDGEGVATQARELVSAGVLRGYVLGSYAARRLGMRSTGNAGGVHNLTLAPGHHDFAGMLAEMGEGLVVTHLMGQGVNTVTGDYSRGAAGFWVSGGEIAFPVEEITIAGNLGDMWRDVVAVGNDPDLRGNIRTPSLLIGGMTIAGQ